MPKIKSVKNYTHKHMRVDMLTKVHWCGCNAGWVGEKYT